MKNYYWEASQSMLPQKAFQFLEEANERFVNNLHANQARSIYIKNIN